jgi:hypothetical protein
LFLLNAVHFHCDGVDPAIPWCERTPTAAFVSGYLRVAFVFALPCGSRYVIKTVKRLDAVDEIAAGRVQAFRSVKEVLRYWEAEESYWRP